MDVFEQEIMSEKTQILYIELAKAKINKINAKTFKNTLSITKPIAKLIQLKISAQKTAFNAFKLSTNYNNKLVRDAHNANVRKKFHETELATQPYKKNDRRKLKRQEKKKRNDAILKAESIQAEIKSKREAFKVMQFIKCHMSTLKKYENADREYLQTIKIWHNINVKFVKSLETDAIEYIKLIQQDAIKSIKKTKQMFINIDNLCKTLIIVKTQITKQIETLKIKNCANKSVTCAQINFLNILKANEIKNVKMVHYEVIRANKKSKELILKVKILNKYLNILKIKTAHAKAIEINCQKMNEMLDYYHAKVFNLKV